eukprot:m.64190 g.64190  ORF g.64190 m.64190 type:complete len:441 (-) comp9703_c0_seq2:113-1435(-)
MPKDKAAAAAKKKSLPGGVTCANCQTKGTPQSLKKCARCMRVFYCNETCQRAHWKTGGHKKVCVAARDTIKAAPKGRVAKATGTSEKPRCIICLEDSPPPLQSGCGCRGAAGLAHAACRIEDARHAPDDPSTHTPWTNCRTCGQEFNGRILSALSEAHLASLRHDKSQVLWVLAMSARARVLASEGRLAEAQTLLHEALPESIRRDAEDIPGGQTVLIKSLRASVALGNARFAESVTMFRELLAEHGNAPGTENAIVGLAEGLAIQGEFAEAVAMLQKVLDTEVKTNGKASHTSLSVLSSLVSIYSRMGEEAKADVAREELLALQRRVLGPEHPDTLTTLIEAVNMLSKKGEHARIEEECRKAMPRIGKVMGERSLLAMNARTLLIDALTEQDKLDEADRLSETTILTASETFGPTHPMVIKMLENWQLLQKRIDAASSD